MLGAYSTTYEKKLPITCGQKDRECVVAFTLDEEEGRTAGAVQTKARDPEKEAVMIEAPPENAPLIIGVAVTEIGSGSEIYSDLAAAIDRNK